MIEWLGSSHYSFLEGVHSPAELVESAATLGYQGLGLADRMGWYGAVQGLKASREADPNFFYACGIRLHFDQADPLFVYPRHKGAYSQLCKFLSKWALDGMSHQEKGLTLLPWSEFVKFLKTLESVSQELILISVPKRFYPWPEEDLARVTPQELCIEGHFSNPPQIPGRLPLWLLQLRELCGSGEASALSLAWPLTQSPGMEDLCRWLLEVHESLEIPLLATTLPLFIGSEHQRQADLITAIRHKTTIDKLGWLRQANGERRLLSRQESQLQYEILEKQKLAQAWDRAEQLKSRYHFSLSELRYSYPKEAVPPGLTPSAYLRQLSETGLKQRYGSKVPVEVRSQLEHELKLVSELKFEDYFLTIFDVLEYARSQQILFQGRGSAANSVLCYVLGITAIDPVRMNLLFERFLSVERGEPPDIDVDFEHERREEVIQEIYRRYGRARAAMVATTITFKSRMAVRETAKALGFTQDQIHSLIRYMGREGLRRLDVEPQGDLLALLKSLKVGRKKWRLLLELAPELIGRPRHMGIHTGGFVLASTPLTEQCILEPARMQNRSIVPWDKDDVDYLSWMKVDLLSLGMLSAIRRCFDLIADRSPSGQKLSLSTVPAECPKVYEALNRADTVGVFQIESRAQMNMLPRLKPRTFYDLVVEVAIVRPGPLQGGMVHPYLKRRQGLEPVIYDHPKLKPILEKTLGVPIFQEQVMKMAVAIAGFTPGEADQLRKVMSGAWRTKTQKMPALKEKLLHGMLANGLSGDFATRVYKQIEGFGEYGFPESHAASFAILTYISSWIKVHRPAEFLVALLNSQPMGFYVPRSLILDAEQHGVTVLPIEASLSKWETRLENNPYDSTKPWVRLGLNQIRGFREKDARIVEALQRDGVLSADHDQLPTLETLRAAGLDSHCLEALIRSGSLRVERGQETRRTQLWEFYKNKNTRALNPALVSATPKVAWAEANTWEQILQDYAAQGFSVGPERHPAFVAREVIFQAQQPWMNAEKHWLCKRQTLIHGLGLLSVKQRPPTAGGLVFLTIEDESGFFNLTLMPDIYERVRMSIEYGKILAFKGSIERSAPVNPQDPKTAAVSVRVDELWDPFQGSPQALNLKTRDYH
jgi:DNA-directed DNA polymerase III PolC